MIIDPIDIKLVRQLESQGGISLAEIIAKFHITKEEILLRIKNFEDTDFISGYGLKLLVPAIIGGKWFLGCASIESSGEIKPEANVPFLEEKIENLTFPAGVSPGLSILFYTQDLKNSYRLINKIPGLKYGEVYKVSEYNIVFPKMLLKDDWQIITELCNTKLNYKLIHSILYEPTSVADIKLSRLIWHKKNRHGVLSIYPNFNWSIIKNYLHLHLAVITKMRSKELKKIINNCGFSANITSKFKKQYLQLEFDAWGFSDIQTIISSLKKDKQINN